MRIERLYVYFPVLLVLLCSIATFFSLAQFIVRILRCYYPTDTPIALIDPLCSDEYFSTLVLVTVINYAVLHALCKNITHLVPR